MWCESDRRPHQILSQMQVKVSGTLKCGSYLLESKALSSSFSVHVNFGDFIEFLGWTDMLPTESHRTLSNFMLHKPV